MARHIHLHPHLPVNELARRYRQARDPVLRSRWQMLWLLACGQTATQIAQSTGYSRYWIGQIAKRYNVLGAAGVADRRHRAPGAQPLVSPEQQEELRQALAGPPPAGDWWSGRLVAEWISQRIGRPVRYQLGWDYLQRLHARPLQPRPRHVEADHAEQDAFKKISARSSVR